MFIKSLKLILIFVIFSLTACESLDIVPHETDLYKEKLEAEGKEPRSATPIMEFFPDMFGQSKENLKISITYNVALDKFSRMPIITADKSGGIITTDWYSTSSNADERVRFNIIIKDEKKILQIIDFNQKTLKISYGKKKHYLIKII